MAQPSGLCRGHLRSSGLLGLSLCHEFLQRLASQGQKDQGHHRARLGLTGMSDKVTGAQGSQALKEKDASRACGHQ